MTFLIITNGLDAAWPVILKWALDGMESRYPMSEMTKIFALFFFVMASLATTRFLWRFFFGRFHSQVAENLRRKIFSHLTTLGPSFFQKNPVGELMSLMTNDVQSFRQAIGPGQLILADGIIITLFVFPIMLWLNWVWTLKTLIFLPLVPFLIWWVMKLIHENYKVQQDRFSELTGMSQETVAGIRVIKGFVQEDHRMNVYNQTSQAFEKACNKVAKVDSLFMPVMEFGVASGSVILLFIVSDEILSGTETLGTFIAFQRYIHKMVWPMTALGLGLSQIQKGFASFSRIKNVLDVKTDLPDSGTHEVSDFKSLEFRNVTFIYPGETKPSLKNVSFSLQRGDRLGIVGPVGSGKSTLLQLLIRLFPLEHGEILINGIRIEDIKLSSLRKLCVLIPQETFLFSESVEENVFFGLPKFQTSTEEQNSKIKLKSLLETVNISEEIRQLPSQEDSQLGERGINLSGGQKQRLAIARGLALNPDLLILDDVLSAVDTTTEKLIEEALQRNPHQTRMCVAHRLSSLKSTNKILVLNDGHVEALGTMEELRRISPTFRKIEDIQSADERRYSSGTKGASHV
jgi:ATP-binding cassette subfamily B protein